MMDLPPVAPTVGMRDRVRLGRDYYVRVLGNDYSVDPTVIGRFVDITAGLTEVTVTCAGQVVATHERCWDLRRTITDPAHVATAAALRQAYRARSAAVSGPAAKAGAVVGVRALSDYDDLFALTPAAESVAVTGSSRHLEVVR